MYSSSPTAEILGAFLIVFVIAAIIGIVVMVLYLLTLQNALKAISPENQKMPPGQVWLALIPLFGLVWQFIIVNRMADSLKAEFAKRNISSQEDRPGYSIGLTYCILYCCSVIPVLGGLAALGGIVCWIIYWVKIAGYKTKLEMNNHGMM
ncbi:MAG: DUF4328 domain-containing protein [Bacteroidia bacterium]